MILREYILDIQYNTDWLHKVWSTEEINDAIQAAEDALNEKLPDGLKGKIRNA